jgi:hypothetical protein
VRAFGLVIDAYSDYPANLGHRYPVHPSIDRSQRQQPSSLVVSFTFPATLRSPAVVKSFPNNDRCDHLLPPNQTAKLN